MVIPFYHHEAPLFHLLVSSNRPQTHITKITECSISIHLQPRDDGNIEVQVQLEEIVEDSYNKLANPATATPLRDPAGYDAFFDEMERQLQGLKGK